MSEVKEAAETTLSDEVKTVVEQQADTNKEVKSQVKKASKAEEKIIVADSNPCRPDVKYVQKGDLYEPVEQ